MEIMEMAGWPGTPGRARMEAAIRTLRENRREVLGEILPWEDPEELSQVHRDVRMMLTYREIRDFHTDSHDEIEGLMTAEQVQGEGDILKLLEQEPDERFIPLLIDLGKPPAEPEPGRDYGLIMTRLSRDLEWVGMNEILPYCRDLVVNIVSKNREPQEPRLIIATAPGNFGLDGDEEPPPGLGPVIQDVMKWHQAIRCEWHHPPVRPRVTAGRR